MMLYFVTQNSVRRKIQWIPADIVNIEGDKQ